jgi:glycosyltransferase involved in cell wall biosynthesis
VKVLLVADAVGGVFTHAVELAAALHARRVRVVLATEGAELTPDRRRAVDALTGVIHEGRPFRLEWMPDPWDDVAAAGRWLLALEERERPDVVHTCELAHGALPFRAPTLVAGHSCVVSWYESVRGVPAPPDWDRYRAVVRAGLRGADAVVAPSAWMAQALARHHAPILAPAVVPNGREAARYWPGPKEELVLAAGRLWDEAKNVAALVRVAPRLPWPVLVAGDTAVPGGGSAPWRGQGGPDDGSAPRAAEEAGSAWRRAEAEPEHRRSGGREPSGGEARLPPGKMAARFLGRLSQEELARWLSRASIFAHPARYEPFGLAVLEAALSGCALVLGDLGSLRENWDGAAEFVPPWDEDALADAISRLAANESRRSVLAARARARGLEFTPARMAAGYLERYRELAAGRRRRSTA